MINMYVLYMAQHMKGDKDMLMRISLKTLLHYYVLQYITLYFILYIIVGCPVTNDGKNWNHWLISI